MTVGTMGDRGPGDRGPSKSEFEMQVLSTLRFALTSDSVKEMIDVQPQLYTNAGQPTLIVNTADGMFAVSVQKLSNMALADERSFH